MNVQVGGEAEEGVQQCQRCLMNKRYHYVIKSCARISRESRKYLVSGGQW